jgi:transcriptional regulator with XRE-family HTH domain
MSFTFAAMTKLAEYMKAKGLRDQALADLLDCDRSMVTKLRHGTATPSLPLALAIHRETGVPLPDLMPIEAAQ